MSGGGGGVRQGHSTVQPESVLVLPGVQSPPGGYSFQLLDPQNVALSHQSLNELVPILLALFMDIRTHHFSFPTHPE